MTVLDTFKSEFLLTTVCVDMTQSNCSLVPFQWFSACCLCEDVCDVMRGFCPFVLRDVLLPLAPEATDIVVARVSGVPDHGGMRMLSPLSYRSKSPVTSQTPGLPCMT